MKKIVSLFIALSCIFALFSCGETPIDSFAEIVSSSAPTKIVTLTSYNDGDNTLTGEYKTEFYGSDFTMYCNYEFYQAPTAGLDPGSYITSEPKTIYYRDGLYAVWNHADGEEVNLDELVWGASVPNETAMQLKLNLDAKKVKSQSVSSDKKSLEITVATENAEAVLGCKLAANENGITIVIEHDGKSLRKISVSYVTESEAEVYYETSYAYNKVVSPFAPVTPPAEDPAEE